ncbi:MAG: hypothetical protein ACM3JP_00720 [Betaproteobacteria bacterium]
MYDPDQPLDKLVADAIGAAAARTLSDWASAHGLSYSRPRWFTNGRSGALVAAVYEHRRGRGTRRLIMKYEPAGGPTEYSRLGEAWEKARPFARRHLPRAVHEPIPVGDGGWVLFQELAGSDLGRYGVLTALLAGVPHSGVTARGDIEPVACDRHTFAGVCAAVVDGMLRELAVRPDIEAQEASAFLESHFGDRTRPGGRLRALAHNYPDPFLLLPGENRPLPNPFRFIFQPPPHLSIEVPAIVGRAHGDPHTENILVRVEPDIHGADFYLVDLARYRGRAPLTAEPVQLVLSILNRTMSELSVPQRDLLLDLLVVGGNADESMLPAWLTGLLHQINDTVDAWLRPSGLGTEWRQLMPLSTLAGALIFMARSTTPEINRAWFLRLAARAAATFEEGVGAIRTPTAALALPLPPDVPRAIDDGRLALCLELPELRALAAQRGRLADLDAIISLAELGQDVRDQVAVLRGEVYGAHPPAVRPLPGLGPWRRGDAYFTCPLAVACRRIAFREPSAAPPTCGVLNRAMIENRAPSPA